MVNMFVHSVHGPCLLGMHPSTSVKNWIVINLVILFIHELYTHVIYHEENEKFCDLIDVKHKWSMKSRK